MFRGVAFGAGATIAGECVFNTSMTGYQEILTDPSYFGQIVTMTAAQIGNYGVNDEDAEAAAPKASGFVVRELSPAPSNWRSRLSLGDYLSANGIPGISEVDTRALTKKLRVDGAMKCCLSTLPIPDEKAVDLARGWKDMAGADYVKDVTCREPYVWAGGRPGEPQPALRARGHGLRGRGHARQGSSGWPRSTAAPSAPSTASSCATASRSTCSRRRLLRRRSRSTARTASSSPTGPATRPPSPTSTRR